MMFKADVSTHELYFISFCELTELKMELTPGLKGKIASIAGDSISHLRQLVAYTCLMSWKEEKQK